MHYGSLGGQKSLWPFIDGLRCRFDRLALDVHLDRLPDSNSGSGPTIGQLLPDRGDERVKHSARVSVRSALLAAEDLVDFEHGSESAQANSLVVS